MSPPPPKEHPEVADRAEVLGDDGVTMESYALFQDKKRGWFFSPNPGLVGAKKRPIKVESWKAFKGILNLGDKGAKVIADLAGLPDNSLSEKHWPALKRAYDGWPADRHAVFQSSATDDSYLCNVFTGDVLYLARKARIRDGGKYYSAADFNKGGIVPHCEQVDPKQVARGDIASWDFGHAKHLEIITKVLREKGIFSNTNAFCSRGAGRGWGKQGTEKCDDSDRQLMASNIKFFRAQVICPLLVAL